MSDSPDRVDVAVIGAGVIGLGCAAWLQRYGRAPVLFDAAGLANGASFGTAGLINGDAHLPVAMPGMLRRVPGWLMACMGRCACGPPTCSRPRRGCCNGF